MVQLINELEKLGFSLENGTYTYLSLKSSKKIMIQFSNHYMECYESDNLLFSILYMDLNPEVLLILLSEFNILEKTIKK